MMEGMSIALGKTCKYNARYYNAKTAILPKGQRREDTWSWMERWV